jgi:hypothetical protein
MSKRTKGETCEEILLDYLQKNEGWHKKVHLYAVAEDYSPETVGRCLRDLCENGMIFVDYYDGKISKNLCMYSIAPKKELPKIRYEEIVEEGIRKVIPIYE